MGKNKKGKGKGKSQDSEAGTSQAPALSPPGEPQQRGERGQEGPQGGPQQQQTQSQQPLTSQEPRPSPVGEIPQHQQQQGQRKQKQKQKRGGQGQEEPQSSTSQEHTPSPAREAPQPQPQHSQRKQKQQKGPQQQASGGPQQQQRGPQQQAYGGPQQEQQRGLPQQAYGGPQQQQQRGPPQQAYGGPQQQQQQRGPQQQQQRGPPQQAYGGPQQEQQRGPPQQAYGGPQQQQRGPQQQQQRGSQQQVYASPPQQQLGRPQQGQSPQQQPMQMMPPQLGLEQQMQQLRLTSPPPGLGPQSPPGIAPREQRTLQTSSQSSPARSQASSSSKESSPPFGGQGDCLRSMALVKPGTKGRKIPIESNHLALNMGTLKDAVHYDVNIIPDTPKSMLRDVMVLFGRKHYPQRHPAFDGRKNLYSPVLLPFGDTDFISDTITVEGENNRPREFKVEVKFARMVDLSPLHNMLKTKIPPQDALQCLDIVLRNAPSNTCITAGRCFFTPPNQIIPLGDGMEMYYGFYQSAIRGWKPLLNVDVAHKAFPTALGLLELACELGTDYYNKMTLNDLNRGLSDTVQGKLEKFLRTLKVKYEIPGQSGSRRIQRVNGLGEAPSRAKFKMDDGRETTVENYFKTVKRVTLRYPNLPTVWVGARERENKILFPMEFCSVVEGQAVNRKMTENQTSAMIKKSATSTEVRKQKIMNTLRTANFNIDPCIKEFGFSVNDQFEKLEARVLQPPSLLYDKGVMVTPSKGVWRADRNKFLIGATINKWTIACVTRRPCKMEELADKIYSFAGYNGINITSKAIPPFTLIGGRQTISDITNYFRSKQDYDLIFVVVPNSGPQYSFVKSAAELNVGCLTQCIKERTLSKLNPQTVGNILLKVNSKMNGTNHSLSPQSRPPILSRPCMIMGADVTHPSPDAKDIPSVAAVTASHDPKAFQYNICWRLQPPKVEIIEDLCNITIEQLKFFYKQTGFKPERIVFFRDGVSEGQFAEVQRAEIMAIRKACKALQREDYEPSITFLVVQKRHHTRFFPLNPRDSEDRNMNVPAGTCVDTMITNPTMQDFYLVSHASIQGVAKPTKYCTLWDENNMSNDDIEELAYHLCHMFTRCNRSVSYPAPTYYAHLAAARAKVYIENEKLNLSNLKQHQQKYQIKEIISKGKPMFFV